MQKCHYDADVNDKRNGRMNDRQAHFIDTLQSSSCYIGDSIKDNGGRTGKHQFTTGNIIRRRKQHANQALPDHHVSNRTWEGNDHIKFNSGRDIVI